MLVLDTPECASWAVAAQLVAQLPGDFRLLEGHPAGGTYDLLWLYRRGRPSNERHEVRLNRNGRIHVGRPGVPLTVAGGDDVWRSLARGEQSVDEVCRAVLADLDLPPGEPLRQMSDEDGAAAHACRTRTFAAIAQVLSLAHGAGLRWRCWWGVEDTAGYGSGSQRAEYFEPYVDDLSDTVIRDGVPYGSPHKHWFVVDERDRPVVAFDVDGYIALPRGRRPAIDLTQGSDTAVTRKVWRLARRLVLAALEGSAAPGVGLLTDPSGAWGWWRDQDGDSHVAFGTRVADLRGWSLVVRRLLDDVEHSVPFTLGVAWEGPRGLTGQASYTATSQGIARAVWQASFVSGETEGLRDPLGDFRPLP